MQLCRLTVLPMLSCPAPCATSKFRMDMFAAGPHSHALLTTPASSEARQGKARQVGSRAANVSIHCPSIRRHQLSRPQRTKHWPPASIIVLLPSSTRLGRQVAALRDFAELAMVHTTVAVAGTDFAAAELRETREPSTLSPFRSSSQTSLSINTIPLRLGRWFELDSRGATATLFRRHVTTGPRVGKPEE